MPDIIKLATIRQKVGDDIVKIYPQTTDAQVIVGESNLAAKLATMDTATETAINTANTYTDTAITNLVNGAPDALNTLAELAAAINDDASFASTITTALAGKSDTTHDHDDVYLKLVGGTVTGEISTPTATAYADLANANLVNKGQAETRLSDFALTTSLRQSYVSTTQPTTFNEGDLWFEVTSG